MARPPGATAATAEELTAARRQPVIGLSLHECTGCAGSLTRSHTPTPTRESTIFEMTSLGSHHPL